MTDTTVKVLFIGDSKKLQSAINDVDKDLGGLGTTTKKFETQTKKLNSNLKSAAGGFGVGLLIGPVAGFAGELFSLGQKMDALNIKAKTVFEDSLPAAKKWADESAHSMGLTKNAAIGVAAGFADLLKPMGFTAAQATEMSTQVVGLSGALSAWTGGTRTAAEVSDILAKAMLGEREGLKGLGISILDVDVKARLLKNGTSELTGAALEQAKAIATQQLIFEKSADAQKAWSSGQFEGIQKTNELKAKVQELKESLAAELYPWIVDVTTKVVDFLPKLDAWWDKQEGLRGAIHATVELIKLEVEGIKTLVGWIQGFIGLVESLNNALGGGNKATWLTELQKNLPGPGERFVSPPGPGETFRAPGRAMGGPALAGHSYTVGERGPELLTMGGRSGHITPNGGTVVNVTVQGNVWGTDLEKIVAKAVVDASNNFGGLPIRIRAAS